jgi:hypothetical protein
MERSRATRGASFLTLAGAAEPVNSTSSTAVACARRPSRLLTKRLHAAMSDSSATVPRLAGNIMGARVGALESDGSRALYKKRWRQL